MCTLKFEQHSCQVHVNLDQSGITLTQCYVSSMTPQANVGAILKSPQCHMGVKVFSLWFPRPLLPPSLTFLYFLLETSSLTNILLQNQMLVPLS